MTPRFARRTAPSLLLLPLLALGGCSGEPVEDSNGCLDPLPEDCTPLYPGEFDGVFENTLQMRCGVGGSSCHASEGARGGLVFEEVERSYQLLVDPSDVDPRVRPGDPECSPLMRRLEAAEGNGLMPPGAPLSPRERCAVAAWIRAGAQR